jgi:hypothetical protein
MNYFAAAAGVSTIIVGIFPIPVTRECFDRGSIRTRLDSR